MIGISQGTTQPIVLVCQRPLCICPHLQAQLQLSGPRALGRGASYRSMLALSRAGSCRFGDMTISKVVGTQIWF